MPKPVRASERRITTTPNASMTTLASPTQGPSHELAMWGIEMGAGQQGPPHTFDSEQVWTVRSGTLDLEVDGERLTLAPGDTIVLPAGAQRQATATTDLSVIACGSGHAIVQVPGEDAPRGTPPWIS